MMRLPSFTYLVPRTTAEAAVMLTDNGPEAAVVAGGTGLYPAMKRRQVTPTTLVSLSAVDELRGISALPDGSIRVGGMTRLSDLARSDLVPAALASAASAVASPQIRAMGTVAGNLCLDTRCTYYDMPEDWRQAVGYCLKAGGDTCRVAPAGARCWAISSSDLAPAAIALRAEVTIVNTGGGRSIPLAEFYRPDGLAHLAIAPGEIVTGLLIPPLAGWRVSYRKVRQRASIDFPLLSVAAGIRLAADGSCQEARIVLGAIASAPLRCAPAERLLAGRRLTPESLREAGEAAARPARPLDNADLAHFYRKWVIPVHVARALRDVSGPAGLDASALAQ